LWEPCNSSRTKCRRIKAFALLKHHAIIWASLIRWRIGRLLGDDGNPEVKPRERPLTLVKSHFEENRPDQYQTNEVRGLRPKLFLATITAWWTV
jgi:hypothetical protein